MNIDPRVAPLLRDFVNTAQAVRSSQPVHIFYHGDPDGLTAAAIAQATIEKLKPDCRVTTTWVGTHQFDFALIEDYLKHHDNEVIYFFDLNLSSKAGFLAFLGRHDRNHLVIVDDHIVNDSFLGAHTTFLNPNLSPANGTPVDLPASLFAYLCSTVLGVEVPVWVPAVGLFADRQLEQQRRFLSGDIPPGKELFAVTAALSNVFLDPGVANKNSSAISFVTEHIRRRSPWAVFCRDLHNNQFLSSVNVRLQEALAREVEIQRTEGPTVRLDGRCPILVFKQHSPFRFTNLLASSLRSSFAGSTTLVYRSEAGTSFFELRVGDDVLDVNLVDVLHRVSGVIGLRNYGGHARAAGGACTDQCFDAMVRRYADFDRELKKS